jgi:hypothetical protein
MPSIAMAKMSSPAFHRDVVFGFQEKASILNNTAAADESCWIHKSSGLVALIVVN